MLQGHIGKVNAVKFYPSSEDQPLTILSGSVDQTVRVWTARAASSARFGELVTLKGHSSSINCLAVSPDTSLFASGSADATIKIWEPKSTDGNQHYALLQTIQTNPKFFPLALALSGLGASGDLVLAVAGTRGFVQIHLAKRGGSFSLQATLTGHEGWVRSLSFAKESGNINDDILLASASQDKYIRLWRIQKGREAADLLGFKQNDLESAEGSLSNKVHRLEASEFTYLLTFEALLLGHEDWIYTVSWRANGKRLKLLSASADNSLAFWEPELSSGVWVCTTRLGEISAQKGSTTATGSTGGFWAGLWSPSGENVVSLGRTGSWRLWNHDKNLDRWMQGIGVSGHTKPVADISWAKDGTYLLSTGSDQTTRLHAEWRSESGNSWHEMSRPQIHGYDINCLDSMGQSQFVSGADEKLLRVFDEPRATADLLYSLCGTKAAAGQNMPDAADIPVLGLSNKVVAHENPEKYDIENGVDDQEPSVPTFTDLAISSDTDKPPSEDHLARHTLWPEREKLYGHGYEISAVASTYDGAIIATACKASSIDHAVVRLYTTKNWREVKPSLTAHSLTITCLRFSQDGRHLLSVGRDRQWVVYEREDAQSDIYKVKHLNLKGHSRMILSASWAPPEAGLVFATAGRDKAVKIWKIRSEGNDCVTAISSSSPVTAVDIFPESIRDTVVVAIGTENGDISLCILNIHTLHVQSSYTLDDS